MACTLILLALGGVHPASGVSAEIPGVPASGGAAVALPFAARGAVSGTLGRDDPAYHALPSGAGFGAVNRRHDLRFDFTRDGLTVRSGADQIAFGLRAWGYGDALSAVSAAMPRNVANRVEYRRGNLTEWYVNGPFGLEQGFTLKAPPARRGAGPLVLALSVSGSFVPTVDAGGRSLTHGPRPCRRQRGEHGDRCGGDPLKGRPMSELAGRFADR